MRLTSTSGPLLRTWHLRHGKVMLWRHDMFRTFHMSTFNVVVDVCVLSYQIICTTIALRAASLLTLPSLQTYSNCYPQLVIRECTTDSKRTLSHRPLLSILLNSNDKRLSEILSKFFEYILTSTVDLSIDLCLMMCETALRMNILHYVLIIVMSYLLFTSFYVMMPYNISNITLNLQHLML